MWYAIKSWNSVVIGADTWDRSSLTTKFPLLQRNAPTPGVKIIMPNATFWSLLHALYSSDVTTNPHREALILYYDIVRIQSCLSNWSSISLHLDDMLYLFETIGLLLGRYGLDVPEQQKYLTTVITHHTYHTNKILNSSDIQCDPNQSRVILASLVAAIAFLSKGFIKQLHSNIELVLTETIPIYLDVLKFHSNHTEV